LINFLQIVTDIPMLLDFYRFGSAVRPPTETFCTWWTFYECSLFVVCASLTAWISIERHPLIFHDGHLGGVGSWKRWSLHVAPWTACFIWAPLFYVIIVVSGLACTNKQFLGPPFCELPCVISPLSSLVQISFSLFVSSIKKKRLLVTRRATTGTINVEWSFSWVQSL
jgi:hypothetical protein